MLIKDMKMPKSCKSCDLLQDYDGDMYCPLNSYLNFGDIEYVPDYVMIGCPISEAPERKKGKWLPDNNNYIEERFICSACGRSYKVDTCMGKPMWDFCPCGADMRTSEDK